MYSNCLIYAVRKYLSEGGYILCRRSVAWRYLPHFLHRGQDGMITHFRPYKDITGPKVLMYSVYFKGYIATGDR